MLDGVVKQSKFPLYYHITPTEGLLNDPNGLIQFKGMYHVFYQWNPFGTEHDNKHWGHLVSLNMVNWQRKTIALAPSEYYDKDGIYSGSAIVKDDVLYLFYTGNVIAEDGTKHSYQCYATSEDGLKFQKKGPLFPHPQGYTRHVRDPKVWYSKTEEKWFLVLGAQTDDLRGTAIWYASKDLVTWEFLGEMLDMRLPAYMWECPDVFKVDEQWVLLLSPQGLKTQGHQFQNLHHSVYVPLTQTGRHFKPLKQPLQEIDWGFEFYAPQTFEADDGRRILYGWMGIMEPEKEKNIPTASEGWVHALTIPREVLFKEGSLRQKPVEELKMLRGRVHTFTTSKPWQFESERPSCEIELQFTANQSFQLRVKKTTVLSYDAETRQLKLERLDWLTHEPEIRLTYLTDDLSDLQIFVDGSSIEIFANGGTAVATARYFETGDLTVAYTGTAEGVAHIYELER